MRVELKKLIKLHVKREGVVVQKKNSNTSNNEKKRRTRKLHLCNLEMLEADFKNQFQLEHT